MTKEYKEWNHCPPYVALGEPGYADAPFRWSNTKPVPDIGDAVKANINGLGTGVVTGYFTLHGYVGILVRLDNPPDWYVKQNEGNKPGELYGAEID